MHLLTIKASYKASRAFFLVSRQKISPYGKGSSRRHFNKALAARLILRTLSNFKLSISEDQDKD